MLSLRDRLTVLWNDNGTFKDISRECHDFRRDTKVVDLAITADVLYLGYYKPISGVYVDLSVLNTNAATLTVQACLNNTWTTLAIIDDTLGCTRSGFIRWDVEDIETSVAQVLAGSDCSDSLHWLKITTTASFSGTTAVGGISLLFSDDQDLLQEDANCTGSGYLAGQSSTLKYHLAARNDILSDLRKRGIMIVDKETGYYKGICAWDLLNIEDVNEAAKWRALYKIYYGMVQAREDLWDIRSKDALAKYEKLMQGLQFPQIDQNDDGQLGAEETSRSVSNGRFVR